MSKTNLEVLQDIGKQLEALEAEGKTDTDEHEALSELYLLIAHDELPLWDDDEE